MRKGANRQVDKGANEQEGREVSEKPRKHKMRYKRFEESLRDIWDR